MSSHTPKTLGRAQTRAALKHALRILVASALCLSCSEFTYTPGTQPLTDMSPSPDAAPLPLGGARPPQDLSLLPDAGEPVAGEPVAGEPVAGMPVAGEPVAGEPVAGMPVAGMPVAGMPVAGMPVAGMPVAGMPVAGMPQAGMPQAGMPQAGEPVAGTPQAGEPVAGTPQAGEPMGGAPQGGATPPVSAYPWGLEGFRWFFSIHASELNYDLNRARAALNEVVALGGVGVRTDIFWYDLEPQRGVTDAGRLAFYQGYLLLAQELGLKPLVILSGAPGWAVDLYRTNRALFWTSLESYARLVALIARDTTEHYQLWNEPNHLIDPIGEADDGELILRLGLIMRSFDPTAMLAVNAMCNVLGWEESVDRWLQAARGVIDVIGIDHYPGTWAGLSFTDWTPLQTLSRRINAPDDLWYGKTGAVMETGYSTWAAIVADEARQMAWVNESLAALRDLVGIFNRERPHKVLFGNYYQLIDVSTSGVGQEAHFGVLRSDLQRKPAFTALTLQLSQF